MIQFEWNQQQRSWICTTLHKKAGPCADMIMITILDDEMWFGGFKNCEKFSSSQFDSDSKIQFSDWCLKSYHLGGMMLSAQTFIVRLARAEAIARWEEEAQFCPEVCEVS